jgi:hypothetical protein
MTLNWTRTQDGTHNGRPCYEYRATGKGGEQYNIVWSTDAGFGYSAVDGTRDQYGSCRYLTKRHGLHWAHTLKACKRLCEEIEGERHA